MFTHAYFRANATFFESDNFCKYLFRAQNMGWGQDWAINVTAIISIKLQYTGIPNLIINKNVKKGQIEETGRRYFECLAVDL